MKNIHISTLIHVYTFDELSVEERQLTDAALEATQRSYVPYSNFHVGAAALLENGMVITGTNQENVAYPSGLCAERTTLFYANSQYPDVAVKALAIATCDSEHILSPCGACRQVMAEIEKRYRKPIRILLCGKTEVYVVESAAALLPLTFNF